MLLSTSIKCLSQNLPHETYIDTQTSDIDVDADMIIEKFPKSTLRGSFVDYNIRLQYKLFLEEKAIRFPIKVILLLFVILCLLSALKVLVVANNMVPSNVSYSYFIISISFYCAGALVGFYFVYTQIMLSQQYCKSYFRLQSLGLMSSMIFLIMGHGFQMLGVIFHGECAKERLFSFVVCNPDNKSLPLSVILQIIIAPLFQFIICQGRLPLLVTLVFWLIRQIYRYHDICNMHNSFAFYLRL